MRGSERQGVIFIYGFQFIVRQAKVGRVTDRKLHFYFKSYCKKSGVFFRPVAEKQEALTSHLPYSLS